MVGCEHDQRVGEQATVCHEAEEDPQLIVDLLDETHVDRDHLGARLVAGERARHLVRHELPVDGMRVAALILRAHGGEHVAGPVHGVVGRGRDVGPVRLDVGEVQAPGAVARLGHEVHGAARHVGSLGVLLLHAGRLPRMPHGPARRQRVALALCGIGPVVPRVVAGVALAVEIAVVARELRVVAAIGAGGVQAIVALVGVEAALRHAHADNRVRVDAQPLHALDVGTHVRLADQSRLHPERAQVVAERHLPHVQRDAVPGGAVRANVAAGVEAHARGTADRRLHVGAGEAHAAGGQGVDVGCMQPGVPVTGQVIPAQLVAHDEEDVADGAHCVSAVAGVLAATMTWIGNMRCGERLRRS